ncbi:MULTISPECIES: APC family permease [unclassified Vibrio]|uniref:APC family permease n=1 Tax=unclassified Vibrio TaxID=2614977 RepID=UPI0018A0D44C|nr:APC family permease [Vibrio sp. VB16]UGA54660.1 APC family permease [Vibrio sp. VB16]
MSKSGDVGHSVLGKWTLLAMGIGITVGAGLFSLVGAGIGLTGHALWLAFGIAIVFGIFYNIPMLFASGSLVLDGGPYALISRILGKKYAGMYVVSFFLYFPTVAIYALALGFYINSLLPTVTPSAGAIAGLTVFYVINLFGLDTLSRFQNMMTTLLMVGIATFILIGFGQVDFALLTPSTNPDFASQGNMGIFKAACLLSFATYCQYYLMYFSKYAKNPKKDIPFGMIGTTITIVFIYIGVSVVASGVLPIDEVANQPLTLVAREVLSAPIFVFFMICGPFMALSTTINSVYASYVQPIQAATHDGWFPKSFAVTNKRGTPWKILTLCWLASMLPILLGWNISTIANTYILTDICIGIFMMVAIAMLPKKFPSAWATREFGKNVPLWGFYTLVGLAGVVQGILIYNSITSIKLYIVVVTAIAFIVGIAYAIKKDKEINVIDSNEEPVLEPATNS